MLEIKQIFKYMWNEREIPFSPSSPYFNDTKAKLEGSGVIYFSREAWRFHMDTAEIKWWQNDCKRFAETISNKDCEIIHEKIGNVVVCKVSVKSFAPFA